MSRKTNEEIHALADEAFKKYNSWDLSRDDLIRLGYKSDVSHETVHVSPDGHEMTRAMCDFWFNTSNPYFAGFLAAYRMLENEKEN